MPKVATAPTEQEIAERAERNHCRDWQCSCGAVPIELSQRVDSLVGRHLGDEVLLTPDNFAELVARLTRLEDCLIEARDCLTI